MQVIKRDGRKVEFDKDKIKEAVLKAFNEVYPNTDEDNISEANNVCEVVCNSIDKLNEISVEQIQDVVENILMGYDTVVAKAYITYRYRRELARRSHTTDDEILSIIDYTNEEVKEENSNKNPRIIPTQRDYIAGAVSKDLTERVFLPKDIVDAHNEGLIHFHDADYFIQKCFNCDLINLEDMLQNGTVISGTMIEKPHSFATACTIATQIIAQVASSQYGGQSISVAHLAPFVQISREKIRKEVIEECNILNGKVLGIDNAHIDEIVEKRVREEIKRGVQTIQYQVVTLLTTNGQAPFITVFMYLGEVQDKQTKHDLALIIEEIITQRYQGVKNEKGVWITPAFPKLIYVLEEDNIHEDSPYYYLTKLAAKCSAKRLVPDYISEKKMKELKEGNCFPVMGCRSALSPWKDENGNYKFYGRFNKGVVTINLVDVACSSEKDIDKFWKIFDERLELCHEALLYRYKRLKGTPSDVAPILWQYGAISRLEKGETIDKLLVGGYSTISLGYAGLCECVRYMTGKSHTDPEATPFAIEVMKHMNNKCAEWNEQLNLG